MARKLPQEILVYAFDYEKDGTPMYAVALRVQNIPEDCDGESVGNYTLNRTQKFRVIRKLGDGK